MQSQKTKFPAFQHKARVNANMRLVILASLHLTSRLDIDNIAFMPTTEMLFASDFASFYFKFFLKTFSN